MESAMNMFTRIIVFAFVLLIPVSNSHAKEIAGMDFAESHELSKAELVLNGAGVRTKFFFKLYVGGLYLKQKSDDAEQIIQADEPMAIKLQIISSMITSEKMEKATREGFHKATDGNIAPIKSQIESFIAVFQEKIQPGDTYDLVYLPARGVDVYKNGTLHSSLAGLDFKQALFGIWLCDKPAQQSLKAAMLGK